MGGKKPLRRPLWPPTRATASNYYPLGLDGAGGAAKPLLRAPKKPAPLHGRLPAFSGAVDAFERARKCFLEWRYFFSIILSEFLKNRVALQPARRMGTLPQAYRRKHAISAQRPCALAHGCCWPSAYRYCSYVPYSILLPDRLFQRMFRSSAALIWRQTSTLWAGSLHICF